jgi:16S rRNA (guanine966-N2)-methyltransferase
VRVVAGTARGRRLATPNDRRGGSSVRPTTDRVRESVFNALHSRGAVVDAWVLDLFAGTGALGIEALSRGATHVTFVDRVRDAVALVEANLDTCDLADRATVVQADGPRWLAAGIGGAAGPWDLVLLDPPYDFDGWIELLEAMVGVTAADGIVVVESYHEVDAGAQWHVDSCRRAAGTVVTLLRPEP